MVNHKNPWLARFDFARARLDSHVGKVINSNSKEFHNRKPVSGPSAELKMKLYLENCFVVTESIYSTARELISHFEALAMERYPDARTFIETIHLDNNDFFEAVGLNEDLRINPICITGLSGEGKSKFAKYFYSLFDGSGEDIKLREGLFFNIEWENFYAGQNPTAKALVSNSILHNNHNEQFVYGKMAYSNGLIGFGVDEVQFATSSSKANASVTNFLMGLGKHCVPWFYICNYSLLWKLMRRNHEDIPRILSTIINYKVIIGYQFDDLSYEVTRYVKVLTSKISDLFDDHEACSMLIGELACGNPRCITNLIALSYRLSYESGAKSVSDSHILKAYKSSSFSTLRTSVENIKRGSSWQLSNKKFDFVYPPELEHRDEMNYVDNDSASDYQALIANLTKAELKILNVGQTPKKRAKVVTLSDVTKEAKLRNDLNYFNNKF
jgi:hypothetical protein